MQTKRTRHRSGRAGVSALEAMALVGAVAFGGLGAFVAFEKDVSRKARCLGITVTRLESDTTACAGSEALSSFATGAAPPTQATADTAFTCRRGGNCTGGACFAPGTPVATLRGHVPIETLAVGDYVISPDPESGELTPHRVERVIRTPNKPLARLEVESQRGTAESLLVTTNHPFWVTQHGWVSVEFLEPGDLLGYGGENRVRALTMTNRTSDVWNVEVEGLHTYLVGENDAWVHNDCTDPAKKLISDGIALDKSCSELQKQRIKEFEAGFKANPKPPVQNFGGGGGGVGGVGSGGFGGGGYGSGGGGYGSGGGGNGSGGGGYGGYGGPLGGFNGGAQPKLAPVNPHAVSDGVLVHVALSQVDWFDRARAIILDPKTSDEDRKAVAKAVADRLANGDCPGSRNPSNPGLASTDPAIQRQIRDAEDASNKVRRAVIDFAKTPAGKDLRPQVRTTVCRPPSDKGGETARKSAEELVKRLFREALQKRLGEELQKGLKEDASQPGTLRRLVQLHYVKDQATKNPGAWKQLNMTEVDRLIAELEANPAVKKQIEYLTERSVAEAREKALELYKGRIAYLRSKEFDDFLELHDDEELRTQLIADQITPIAVIDPEMAMIILEEIQARDMARQVNALTEQQLADEFERALNQIVLDQDGKNPKEYKFMSDASKRVAKVAAAAVKGGKPQDALNAVKAEVTAMHLTPEQAGRFKTALTVLEHLDKNGHATSGAGALGAWFLIADSVSGKAWKDRANTLESFGNIAKLVDSSEGVVKLTAWTIRRVGYNGPAALAALKAVEAPITKAEVVAAGKATPAAKWLLRAKLMGPAGDLLTAASAAMKMDRAIQAGNVHNAGVQCGKFGAALAAFGAGGYLAIAGVLGASTGPAAPIVWLVAAGIYIGFSLFEDSDQEIIMRKLRVHKDDGGAQPKPAPPPAPPALPPLTAPPPYIPRRGEPQLSPRDQARGTIELLYQAYLYRPSDAKGMEGWLQAMDRGATLKDVERGIWNAPERTSPEARARGEAYRQQLLEQQNRPQMRAR